MKQTQVVGKRFKVRIGRVAKTRMKQRILYNLLKMDTGVKKFAYMCHWGRLKEGLKPTKSQQDSWKDSKPAKVE